MNLIIFITFILFEVTVLYFIYRLKLDNVIYKMDIDRKKEILDKLILETKDEYLLFEWVIESAGRDSNYMTEQDQIKMAEYIIDNVKKKISPAIKKNLLLVYPNNKDEFNKVIENKTAIIVINFVQSNNRVQR